MNRKEKELEVGQLSEKLKQAKTLIFTGYRGLKVSEMTELRSKLKKSAASLKVVKNRLVKRALKQEGLSELDKYFAEPTAVASSESDPAAVAKVLVEFAKEHDALKVKGGFLEGKLLDMPQIDVLARLPSREVLLGKAMGSMIAPATNFVCVLTAISRNLVNVINAIKDKKTD